MNQKSLLLLLGAAVLAAGIATFSTKSRDSAVAGDGGKTKVFPGLLDKVNDVASFTLKRKDGEYTLTKSGDTWGLADKGGFPVQVENVRKFLFHFAEMNVLEEKTSNPELYDRLQVEDLDKDGAKSVLVTLKDKSGAPLASLIVGKEVEAKGGAPVKERFVRRSGEKLSLLASCAIELQEKATDWTEKKILEVKRDRIQAIDVKPTDGDGLVVDRAKPEQTDFTLHDIPAGKELQYPTAPSALGGALEYLNFEDVEPAGRIDFAAGVSSVATFKTFDGLVMTVTTKDQDGKTYAQFAATFVAPPPEPTPEKPADPPAGETKPPDAPLEPPKSTRKSAEEFQKEVADLNAQLSKWTYVIPTWNKTNFTKKKSELLKDIAPPAAPTDAPGSSPASSPTQPAPGGADELHAPGDGHDHGTPPATGTPAAPPSIPPVEPDATTPPQETPPTPPPSAPPH